MMLAAVVVAGAGVAVDGIKDDATEGGSMRRVVATAKDEGLGWDS